MTNRLQSEPDEMELLTEAAHRVAVAIRLLRLSRYRLEKTLANHHATSDNSRTGTPVCSWSLSAKSSDMRRFPASSSDR